MFEVALYEPEIPPNTGNIIRLCANTGARLHLIGPLGFELEDRALKRAGLDYHEYASVLTHASYLAFTATLTDKRIFALSTHADNTLFDARFEAGDVFLFGPETRGLPHEMRRSFPPEQQLRLPMTGSSRSLNLSNAVAVVVYEAWRQCHFFGAARPGTCD
ncbi:MAG: tRNA (uridine(34)/cytosine(34)/5-carboxymethylaminomethyluridine(34)-2'-O)-methyltransferase TrmL [Gammaproteobacteria bacterium]|jgi:tRNA (cytidine/uridine-2'-O-)-methyltransferase|nr:tRNA (uridine(34)/cytosine(34)/5-carboxymethylaminomethyluridine(34)-2'-O)-methyltransferase TrmL [Gammaproteobacteria bacterium]